MKNSIIYTPEKYFGLLKKQTEIFFRSFSVKSQEKG